MNIPALLLSVTTEALSVVLLSSAPERPIDDKVWDRDGYDDNSDGFTEIAQLKTRTVGARAFVRPSGPS